MSRLGVLSRRIGVSYSSRTAPASIRLSRPGRELNSTGSERAWCPSRSPCGCSDGHRCRCSRTSGAGIGRHQLSPTARAGVHRLRRPTSSSRYVREAAATSARSRGWHPLRGYRPAWFEIKYRNPPAISTPISRRQRSIWVVDVQLHVSWFVSDAVTQNSKRETQTSDCTCRAHLKRARYSMTVGAASARSTTKLV